MSPRAYDGGVSRRVGRALVPGSRWLLVIAVVAAVGSFAIANWTDAGSRYSTCVDFADGTGGCVTSWPGRPWFLLEVFLGGVLVVAAGALLLRVISRTWRAVAGAMSRAAVR